MANFLYYVIKKIFFNIIERAYEWGRGRKGGRKRIRSGFYADSSPMLSRCPELVTLDLGGPEFKFT